MPVVVADGYADSRASIVMLLQQCGHLAVEAADGAQALEYALDKHACALFVDQDLPHADLEKIVGVLRCERGREILLVLLTAWDEKTHPRPSGFDLCLVKPFDAHKLLGALQKHTHSLESPLNG